MSKLFLTTGEPQKVEAAPTGKYYEYQDEVTEHLKRFGMKVYYAQLATIDFKNTLYDSFYEEETTDTAAVKVLNKAKERYSGKIMIADGACLFSGNK
ncbi:MAG: hypothetical protein E4H14_05550 [Candidatus Thorarchaeota archaeon]|nr:MAG: hypothetical protein E4H14_05550 [Candidatus Thorarchaeota archaeon]